MLMLLNLEMGKLRPGEVKESAPVHSTKSLTWKRWPGSSEVLGAVGLAMLHCL